MKFVSYEPNRIRIFRCSCVKNFRESYVFHCLVIKVVCLCDSLFTLSYLSNLVKHFFKFFSNIFELRFCCRFVGDLDTLSYLLSFVNYEFHFSEILFNCLFFKNNYLRQLSYNTTGSYACQP